MLKVQMVGRTDHQKIEWAFRDQRLDRRERLAKRDARRRQDRRADDARVHEGHRIVPPSDLAHGGQHMGDALAKADDADAIRLGPAHATRSAARAAKRRSAISFRLAMTGDMRKIIARVARPVL